MPTCPTCRTNYPGDARTCPADGATLLPDEVFGGFNAELKPGAQVGEYQIEGKLGEGGFGSVYRAVHPLIGKAAAVKVLNQQYSSNPQMVSRFIAEARAVNQIRHRNIIDIFSFGRLDDGRQYYVMELLDGLTFDAYLRQKTRLSPEEAIPVLRGIARALDAAHAAGIAHRDLKPENIYLVFDEDSGVFPKLLDFGIAKLLSEAPQAGYKTRTGAPIGTPYFMSPEQCRGKNVDHRTDIYSFGVLVHLALTGKLPFDSEEVMTLLFKHINEPPPRLSAACPGLSPQLDAPVLQMLEKDPDKRPASLGAALDALAVAAHGAGYAVQLPGQSAAKGPSGDGLKIMARSAGSGLTPSELGALADAQTMVQSDSGRPVKTLQPSATDVKPAVNRRRMFYAGIGIAAVSMAVGAALAVRPVPSPAGAVAAQVPSAVSALPQAAAASPGPTVLPANQLAAAGTATLEPPAEVELTIQSTPKVVEVYLGKEKLGSSDKPVRIKRSDDKVKLTFKAAGYTSQELELPAGGNAVIAVSLTRAAAKVSRPGSPELEF